MAEPEESSKTAGCFTISPANTLSGIQAARTLFTAYAATLDLDLSFQSFATELSALPGSYAAPAGALLIAHLASTGAEIGCVAVRLLSPPDVCEMKRLYVSPAGRGMGVGKALAEAAVSEARRLGYRAIRLDTLPSMEAARSLYKAMGFKEIEAYYQTPLEGTIFLELVLK